MSREADELKYTIVKHEDELRRLREQLRALQIEEADYHVGDEVCVRISNWGHPDTYEERVVTRVENPYLSTPSYYTAPRKKDGNWSKRDSYTSPSMMSMNDD